MSRSQKKKNFERWGGGWDRVTEITEGRHNVERGGKKKRKEGFLEGKALRVGVERESKGNKERSGSGGVD